MVDAGMFNLRRLARLRVLVVGDVMLDRYWYGDVQRISPEAPVPVVSVEQREDRAGGAANVACNVAALGAQCRLLSVVGDDEGGRVLKGILDDSRIDARLHVEPDTSTTVKLRVVSRNQQLIRLDFENRPGHEILQRCMREYAELLEDTDVVILSDYGKGGLAHIIDMIAHARAASVPVMIDPKGRDYSRYRGATLVTPNRREFEDAAGPWADDAELARKAQHMISDLELSYLLITRSEQGMSLFQAGGGVSDSPARAREVYDVTGAGDTVIAVAALMFAAGASPDQVLDTANAAAGIVVGKLGTATASPAEIARALGAEADR